MTYLLDTNVLSEWVKPAPDPNVMAWLARVDEDRVFLSVATFAEIRHGIELLPPGRRRERLADWLASELSVRFEGRVIDIDRPIAEMWGILVARARRNGAVIATMDAFLAATAEARKLILVTRNVRDYSSLGIRLLDPWEPQS